MSEVKPGLNLETLYSGLMSLNQRLDATAEQLFVVSLIIEYFMQKLSEFKLQDGSTPLAVETEALLTFMEARRKEVRDEMEKAMADHVTKLGKPQLDLHE